jgi:hypothetical protein
MKQRLYGIEGDRHAALLRDAERMRLIDATVAGQAAPAPRGTFVGRMQAWAGRFLATAGISLDGLRPSSTMASQVPVERTVSAGSQHDFSG